MADLLHPAPRPDFHLCLDSADLDALRTCLPHPLVHGVTTNPTLLRRAGLRQADLPRLVETLLGPYARTEPMPPAKKFLKTGKSLLLKVSP